MRVNASGARRTLRDAIDAAEWVGRAPLRRQVGRGSRELNQCKQRRHLTANPSHQSSPQLAGE